MGTSELSDTAWDLVEHCRAALSIADLNTAFVRLGIGEYSDAMLVALRSVVRTNAPALPAQLVERLDRIQQTYHVGPDFADLLSRAPREQC